MRVILLAFALILSVSNACLTPVSNVDSTFIKTEMSVVTVDVTQTLYAVDEKRSCQ